MELLHPHGKRDVAEALRTASADGTRVLLAGGRTHLAKGEPSEVDAELWTTMLDELVEYDPAEMLAVVEAGMRVGDLGARLAEGGQEWPVDAPDGATVGGVIAAGASSPRRLRVGHVRDTVVEMELITGDGRTIRSGARTVKNVTGFDLHRLATGSLGTLGAIVQVALKLRPLPQLRRSFVAEGDGVGLGLRMLEGVLLPAAIVAEPDRVDVRLEGWAEEVEEQTAAARAVASPVEIRDDPRPLDPFGADAPVIAEASVAPSRLPELVEGLAGWRALLGVGLAWFALPDAGDALAEVRRRAAEAGGIAPVIRASGGLGPGPVPAPDVQRRLKGAFDPAGILAPGRGWPSP
ncbi:MAG: FAD-binding protein [Actinomycetota bacterium]